MGLTGWPSITDDDGSLTLGTEIEKAVFDAIKTAIELDLYSATNPTVMANDVIDEVVAARGSKASLDARLDIALNEDGTLKSQASLVTTTDAGTLPQTNVVVNDTFMIWAGGDAVAATGWTLAGTGAACARAGTGLGDTARKVGDFCSKLTYGTTTLTYYQDVLTTAAFSRLDHLQGKTVGFGMWAKSSVASQIRIYITDGVTTTYTSYHTGDGTWQWLSSTHDISGTGTYLRIGASVEASAANPVYVSGATLIFGNLAPDDWRPTPTVYGCVVFISAGTIAVGTGKGYYSFARPTYVKETQLYIKTAGTGQAVIVDVNKDTNSMYSTRPQCADGVTAGAAAPDAATYSYRCFAGGTGAAPGTINFDIDQVGSGTAGADLVVMIRCIQYLDPFEFFKAV